MNRPHFPFTGQAGMAGPGTWRSPGVEPPWIGSAGAGMMSGTAIENLRRLMAYESTLPEERISELRDRVASGAYLNRDAAELTASRMLDDNFDLD